MKKRLAWLMAALMCVTSVTSGTALNVMAQEVSAEVQSQQTEDAVPIVLGEAMNIEIGHNYRSFQPEESGYYHLSGTSGMNGDIRLKVTDSDENEISELIATVDDKQCDNVYYLEQGKTYLFDFNRSSNNSESQQTATLTQVTDQWDYENENVEEKKVEFCLLRPKESGQYLGKTTVSMDGYIYIIDSDGNRIYKRSVDNNYNPQKFVELEAGKTYLVAKSLKRVSSSLIRYHAIKDAELIDTVKVRYKNWDYLRDSDLRVKFTYDDDTECTVRCDEEDPYGNYFSWSSVAFYLASEKDSDTAIDHRGHKATEDDYVAVVSVAGRTISRNIHCEELDVDSLPVIKPGETVKTGSTSAESMFRFTVEKRSIYNANNATIYRKTANGFDVLYNNMSELKPGETYVACFLKNSEESLYLQELSCEHNYVTITDKEPTCAEPGSAHEECSICHEKKSEVKEIPATGKHSFGAYKTVKAATVLSTGTKERVCTVCHKTETASIAKLPATIKLSATKLTVDAGKTLASPKVTFGKGDGIKNWKSSNAAVVAVNAKTGKMTAKKAGSAKVTVTLNSGKKATVEVKVQAHTQKLKANRTSVNLKKGKTFQLKVTVTPKDSVDKVSYKSSNSKVAAVNSKGKIMAKKKGTAVISIVSGKKKISCKVTVK